MAGPEENIKSRTCKICGKVFPSKKGLGGHAGIHNFPDATCSICGIKWQSVKALCAHMRYHRNQERRGIQPPYPLTVASATDNLDQKSNSSSSSDSSVQILGESLCAWPVTGKRGREATAAEEEAADILLNIAQGTSPTDAASSSSVVLPEGSTKATCVNDVNEFPAEVDAGDDD